MKLAMASDHAGFRVKEDLKTYLTSSGHEVVDLGPEGENSVDYPDYASALCRAVLAGEVGRGVLICGTGVGMALAANQHRGIRAAAIYDPFTARMCRAHNDTNVLALGARVTGPSMLEAILDTWLETPFEGGRHQRRLDRVAQLR